MNNIEKIKKAAAESDFDALLITSQENRFYATGYEATDGYLLISPDAASFFADARYNEEAAEKIPNADVVLIKNAADAYRQMNDFLAAHGVKRLGVECGKLSNSSYMRLDERLNAEFSNCQQILANLRMVKDEEELAALKAAQRIAEKSFSEILPLISRDMTERELAAELFCRMIKNGADDRSFETIVVSGTHSSMPHGKAESRPIQNGFLTIDFGCKYAGYCSDTTRTLCIGEPTAEMVKVYDTVLLAQETAIAAAHGGISGKELDAFARNVIKDAGFGEYFAHALSHGVGVEIHEQPNASPLSQDIIPAGAVISVEPGIYIPGRFGVRIEDVICLTETGCEDITELKKQICVVCA